MTRQEPEVLKARLNEFGCPYGADDDRAPAWLEGYAKGYNKASNEGIERLERLAGKL